MPEAAWEGMKSPIQSARIIAELNEEFRSLAGWWLEHVVDTETGALAGEVSNRNQPNPEAGKSLVFVARLLWFFSAAYRFDPRAEYRAAADLAYGFLQEHFHDPEHGGLLWTVDADNRPRSRKKQTYGQAFAIYGLSEYAMAFDSSEALERARSLVTLLEQYANDRDKGGYLEALSADWKPLEDVRLGASDINAEKTMNTHLHILEAYSNFFRAEHSPEFAETLGSLLTLFLDRFVEPLGDSLVRYCTRDWQIIESSRSYGHDIESSWLLWEAASLLGDEALQQRVKANSIALADGVLEHGVDAHGGVVHEGRPGRIDDESRIWWVQAEALVGFFNAWKLTARTEFLQASLQAWAFIQSQQRDREYGEWLWFSKLDTGAEPMYKSGQWKAPYHNGRALLEMMSRLAN